MDFQTIASIVGLSSIISILANIVFGFIEKKSMLKFEKRTQEKEHRYHSALAFMLVVLDSSNLGHVDLSGIKGELVKNMSPDEIRKFFFDEIKAHYIFSHLYASDAVLSKMKAFVDNPTEINYQETAKAMRKDLWA